MSKLHGVLNAVGSEPGRRGTVLALALGLAVTGWMLLPVPARAQDEELPPGHALDICDVTPEDPACRLLTDEEFAAIVADPAEPDWPGAPLPAPWQVDGTAPALSLQGRHPLGVRLFSQNDASWKGHVMRFCTLTIGGSGCTLTSAAMVMWYYGGNKNPAGLNECLGTNACPLYWSALDGCGNGRSRYVGQRGFSYRNVRDLVDSGRPAVLKVKNSLGGPHWVVVVGYDDPPLGDSPDRASLYLINDSYDGKLKRLDRYSGYDRIAVINKVNSGPSW